MRRIFVFLIISILLLSSVSALTASEAKQDWLDAKKVSKERQMTHQEAKLAFGRDRSEENRQRFVETGKDMLSAALDEAEAWLKWKDLEAEENPGVPSEIKQQIFEDVEANLDKVDALRVDVDGVKNQVELSLVFLKMIGKYFELVADVARNSGSMWVYIGNEKADTIEDYEMKLREAAAGDQEALKYLDYAHEELVKARLNLEEAADTYAQVKIPGQPLIRFAEGNNYLNAAKMDLIAAQGDLVKAYGVLMG